MFFVLVFITYQAIGQSSQHFIIPTPVSYEDTNTEFIFNSQVSLDIRIKNGKETVQLKRGFIDSELISEKVEYEDLKRIAQEKGVSLREIRKLILSEIHKADEDNA